VWKIIKNFRSNEALVVAAVVTVTIVFLAVNIVTIDRLGGAAAQTDAS